MRVLLVAALLAASSFALVLAQPSTEKPAPKKDEKQKEKAKPKPRIGIEKGGAAGGDAPGHGGASSLGGTPGTPSGSFTR